MILVTGPTGFIGSVVVEKFTSINNPMRLLLRPKKDSPSLMAGIPFDIAVSSMDDIRGLRAAMKNVDTIFHFATAERNWPDVDIESVDVLGIENLLFSAKEAGVKRILYLSRIGADKNSSFPVLRTKSICEERIRNSGLNFTIIRLSDIFGKNDNFTQTFADAIRYAPGFFPLPGGGKTMLQPLWVEDIISIMILLIEKNIFQNKIYEIGGSEHLSFFSIVKLILDKLGKNRVLIPISSAYLRIFNLWVKPYRKAFPLSTFWLDLLAVNRICPLDSIPRNFNLMPVRFTSHIDYL